LLVYNPLCHWVWASDGFLFNIGAKGAIDFAGGTVVHISAGVSGLVAAIYLGSRRGYPYQVIRPNNLVITMLGAGLLWVGWFGFNGGSVGGISTKELADSVALTIFNTNIAGLAGAISAGILIYLRYKLFDITMILNGALGGLVAVTAGAHLFTLYDALTVGFIGGILVVVAIPLFDKMRIDDPVGALSVHLVNGIWGTLAVGIFASDVTKNITLLNQLKGVVEIAVFVFSISLVFIYLINKVFPFRATDEEQQQGLDVSECGLEAYPEFKRAI
ncbi:MAG: ammonium transporter, partial [Sulfuricurvum sp.]